MSRVSRVLRWFRTRMAIAMAVITIVSGVLWAISERDEVGVRVVRRYTPIPVILPDFRPDPSNYSTDSIVVGVDRGVWQLGRAYLPMLDLMPSDTSISRVTWSWEMFSRRSRQIRYTPSIMSPAFGRASLGSSLLSASAVAMMDEPVVDFDRWGFRTTVHRLGYSILPRMQITAPCWAVIASLLLVTLWLSRPYARDFMDRRRRRRARDQCLCCGYSRRGLQTPDAPCPECGTVPKVARLSHAGVS